MLIPHTDGDAHAEHDALEEAHPQRADGLTASLKSFHAEDLVRSRSTIPFPSFNPSPTAIAPDREAIASRTDLPTKQIDGGSKTKAVHKQLEIELSAREHTRR